MDVIISNDVWSRISEYTDALTRYPITSARAKQKADNMVAAIMALGNTPSALPICMNMDLLQAFDKAGTPKNENLK